MSNLPPVIGITGYATNGKDTLADILIRDFEFERIAFADTLKSMALVLNPIVGRASDIEAWLYQKFHIDHTFPDATVRLSELIEVVGPDDVKKHPEVRRFYQVLGTEGVRKHLGDDIWVTTALKKMREGQRYVISDVRFPNEEKAIHAISGAEVWRVSRPRYGIGKAHASEAFIHTLPVEFEIVNDGTIDDLAQKVQLYLMGQKVVDSQLFNAYAPPT